MLREIPLARHAWELLKPIQSNADTINVERHLPAQFQLAPPKFEPGMTAHSGYHNPPNVTMGERSPSIEPHLPQKSQPTNSNSSPDPTYGSDSSEYPMSPQTVGFNQPRRQSQSETMDKTFQSLAQKTAEYHQIQNTAGEPPASPGLVSPLAASPPPKRPSATGSSGQSTSSVKPSTISASQSKKGRFWGVSSSKKESSTDTNSLSSTSEPQKTEEIQLEGLKSMLKYSVKGKSSKAINVCLSQNSTHAIFWSRPAIHIWDVGTTPPTAERMIRTESTCVLAAVTKTYLAYIIGIRGQRLTVK